MAHLGVAVLESQSRVAKGEAGREDDSSEVDSRQEEVGSAPVVAVRGGRGEAKLGQAGGRLPLETQPLWVLSSPHSARLEF